VSPLDRVCLVLSDDTNVPPPIELVLARSDVKHSMLQLLDARAAKSDRALYPRAKADLQAAFHFLDSAREATSTCVPCGAIAAAVNESNCRAGTTWCSWFQQTLVRAHAPRARHINPPAGHNNMLEELPAIATLVMFNIQTSAQSSDAVAAVRCSPRVVSVPIVAGPDPGPLSPAQLRAIAPALELQTATGLPKLGDFVVTCGSRGISNGTGSRLTAFMEISAVVRSKQVGGYNAPGVVVAARVDLSRFINSALEHVNLCGSACSISLVVASGIHAARVLVTTAVLPPDAPLAPSIFDIEGEIFTQAWSRILAAPTGSINVSGM
jgi:hypothetical protein